MAALTACDELLDASHRIRGLEEELDALRNIRAVAADRARATQTAVANALNSAAERIEKTTQVLEPHHRRRHRDRVVVVVPANAGTQNHRCLSLDRAAAPAFRNTHFRGYRSRLKAGTTPVFLPLANWADRSYIGRAKLRCASGAIYPRGLIDPLGNCPWPGPWTRTYGAHLLS